MLLVFMQNMKSVYPLDTLLNELSANIHKYFN